MAGALLIADVPWLLYRSFFALPRSIVGADGRPVNALLGTVNARLAFYEGRLPAPAPRRVVACMGAEQADYRVELYPAYHAHRDPMPEDLRAQWGQVRGLLEALGFVYADSAELEADDVMFSFARTEAEQGGRALLLTGDRDLFGAVDERVAVVELKKSPAYAEIGREQVRERYGVAPARVPDFIALRGDPSDGLPGAPGVGAKTAAELLREHETLEGVLAVAASVSAAHSAGMRPRIASALRENAELLLRFKRIATLQRIEVQPPPSGPPDFAGGSRAARELGMNALAERLQALSQPA